MRRISFLQPRADSLQPDLWHEIVEERAEPPVSVTRDRVRWLLALLALALCAVLVRAVQLEVTDGATFRRLAARPIERAVPIVAARGRIVARDGTVLAADRSGAALAVHFRYLQEPPDAAWLRRRARARLTAAQRRDAAIVAQTEAVVRAELADLHGKLARLCNLSDAQWQARASRIDRRVRSQAARVNRRRLDEHERLAAVAAATAAAHDDTLGGVLAGLFSPPDPLPPPPLVIVEETAYHRLVDDVPPNVVAEIHQRPERYPGVKIVEHTRRDYPLGTLAAHVVGHVERSSRVESQVDLGPIDPHAEAVAGLMGIERQFQATLSGTNGRALQTVDRRGRALETEVSSPAVAGRDVVLTIDPQLQRAAETWLDHHVRLPRRAADAAHAQEYGGAVVVIDVHSGELAAAASAPRFDPNLFVTGDPRLEQVLAHPAQPLFDRVSKMALPPGSVFKALTALALVSERAVDPAAPFLCRGYLDDPDRLRCELYRQQGTGHGELALLGALAQSCNVYFFHHSSAIGGIRLVDWGTRFGFAQATGIDLPDEAAGQLPSHTQLHQRHETQFLAVGQGAFTATPLQVARLYAAIANGGYLITPRITRGRPLLPHEAHARTRPRPREALRVRGLTDEALAVVREGLARVVNDPSGTAFATVHLPGLTIAGKTGTAETGGAAGDHAWFAGYAPADEPRYAFVIVLEHAGSGGEAAGPLARQLVERMRELGYFGAQATADKSFPPGKG
ncbi:MAG: peptidoglycan D,D-transpeptidase FtsI family protein [Pirellulales bacterium]